MAVNINRTQQSNNSFNLDRRGGKDFIACVLHQRSWKRLSSENDEYFTQEELTSNILLEKEPPIEGADRRSRPLSLSRNPLTSVTEWDPQTEKGFIDIIYRGQLSNDFQDRQNKAPDLEVKEISLSYKSELRSFEAGVDQFFHIYPFGAVEVYFASPSDIITNSGLRVSNSLNRKMDFLSLDKMKDFLLDIECK